MKTKDTLLYDFDRNIFYIRKEIPPNVTRDEIMAAFGDISCSDNAWKVLCSMERHTKEER